METNTIIRTEDSINMGGSFLNETQVRPRVRDPTLSQSYEGTLPPCRHKSGVIITTYLLWPGHRLKKSPYPTFGDKNYILVWRISIILYFFWCLLLILIWDQVYSKQEVSQQTAGRSVHLYSNYYYIIFLLMFTVYFNLNTSVQLSLQSAGSLLLCCTLDLKLK